MTVNQFAGKWEKRWHPLRGEWIVYAAHRNNRPWTTGTIAKTNNTVPEYDVACYLCPGNARVHGVTNPAYSNVHIFDNDHPTVGIHAPEIPTAQVIAGHGLYRREKANGIARVICYDPLHNVSLAQVSTERVAEVFRALRAQMLEFAQNPIIKNVIIFENKGVEVGVSNLHPHGQIYALDFDFPTIQKQLKIAEQYQTETGRNIFAQIIQNEQEEEVRIIAENDGAIAFIPFFARFAYETMLFPKQRHATLASMSDAEIYDLAAVFREVVRRYDANFQMSFPYILTFQQAPVDGGVYPDFHFYISVLPPYRQPGLLKHLAGPETGMGVFMADTMPEEKAAELRAVRLE